MRPTDRGFVRPTALIAALLWMLLALGGILWVEHLRASAPERPPCSEPQYPDITDTPDLRNSHREGEAPSEPISILDGTCGGRPYSQWIKFIPREDQRPFIVRLCRSVRISFSPRLVSNDEGGFRLSLAGTQITGGATW